MSGVSENVNCEHRRAADRNFEAPVELGATRVGRNSKEDWIFYYHVDGKMHARFTHVESDAGRTSDPGRTVWTLRQMEQLWIDQQLSLRDL